MNNSKLLNLTILTPNETLYVGKIQNINIPGEKSAFQVLYNHTPLLSTLAQGKITFLDAFNQSNTFMVAGGIVEILKNNITIAAEYISAKV